jgi:hypothetical protein
MAETSRRSFFGLALAVPAAVAEAVKPAEASPVPASRPYDVMICGTILASGSIYRPKYTEQAGGTGC